MPAGIMQIKTHKKLMCMNMTLKFNRVLEVLNVISHTGCRSTCLSAVISAQFALEMCVVARNRQKFIKLILAFKII